MASTKKIVIGVTKGTIGIATLTGFFLFLMSLGFQIHDITGDISCMGTLQQPCISEFEIVNPTSINYSFKTAANISFSFSPQIKDYAFMVQNSKDKIGKTHLGLNYPGYTEVNFTKGLTFKGFSSTRFKVIGLKNNPADVVKWGVEFADAAVLDPTWGVTPPTQGLPIINSSNWRNMTQDNLTCWNQSTSDPDGDLVINRYTFRRDNQNMVLLYVPFDTNVSQKLDLINNVTGLSVQGATYENATGFDGNGAMHFYGDINLNNSWLHYGVMTNYLNMSNYNFTVTFWINYTGQAAPGAFGGTVCYQDGSHSVGFRSDIRYSDNRVRFMIGNGTTPLERSLSSNHGLVRGQWYFVALVKNGSTMSVYLNGTRDSIAEFPGIENYSLYGKYNFTIGARPLANSFDSSFNGTLDEIRVYNVTLSPGEIALLYTNNPKILDSSMLESLHNYSCCVYITDGWSYGLPNCSTQMTVLHSSQLRTLFDNFSGDPWYEYQTHANITISMNATDFNETDLCMQIADPRYPGRWCVNMTNSTWSFNNWSVPDVESLLFTNNLSYDNVSVTNTNQQFWTLTTDFSAAGSWRNKWIDYSLNRLELNASGVCTGGSTEDIIVNQSNTITLPSPSEFYISGYPKAANCSPIIRTLNCSKYLTVPNNLSINDEGQNGSFITDFQTYCFGQDIVQSLSTSVYCCYQPSCPTTCGWSIPTCSVNNTYGDVPIKVDYDLGLIRKVNSVRIAGFVNLSTSCSEEFQKYSYYYTINWSSDGLTWNTSGQNLYIKCPCDLDAVEWDTYGGSYCGLYNNGLFSNPGNQNPLFYMPIDTYARYIRVLYYPSYQTAYNPGCRTTSCTSHADTFSSIYAPYWELREVQIFPPTCTYNVSANGTYVSRIINSTKAGNTYTETHTSYLPDNTSMTLYFRANNTIENLTLNITGWQTNISLINGQYVQWMAVLNTSFNYSTPYLYDLLIQWQQPQSVVYMKGLKNTTSYYKATITVSATNSTVGPCSDLKIDLLNDNIDSFTDTYREFIFPGAITQSTGRITKSNTGAILVKLPFNNQVFRTWYITIPRGTYFNGTKWQMNCTIGNGKATKFSDNQNSTSNYTFVGINDSSPNYYINLPRNAVASAATFFYNCSNGTGDWPNNMTIIINANLSNGTAPLASNGGYPIIQSIAFCNLTNSTPDFTANLTHFINQKCVNLTTEFCALPIRMIASNGTMYLQNMSIAYSTYLSNIRTDFGGDGTIDHIFYNDCNTSVAAINIQIPDAYITNQSMQCQQMTCNIPITIYAWHLYGNISIYNISVNYSIGQINLSTAQIRNYTQTNCTSSMPYCGIPIGFTATGNCMVNVTSTNLSSKNSEIDFNFTNTYFGLITKTMKIRQSVFSLLAPYGYAIVPNTLNQKNVTPKGQTTTIPIFNISATAEHNSTIRMYARLDANLTSCINLYLGPTANKTNASILFDSDSYVGATTNNTKSGLWSWVDLNSCAPGITTYFKPRFIFNSWCGECIKVY